MLSRYRKTKSCRRPPRPQLARIVFLDDFPGRRRANAELSGCLRERAGVLMEGEQQSIALGLVGRMPDRAGAKRGIVGGQISGRYFGVDWLAQPFGEGALESFRDLGSVALGMRFPEPMLVAF